MLHSSIFIINFVKWKKKAVFRAFHSLPTPSRVVDDHHENYFQETSHLDDFARKEGTVFLEK